MQRKKKNYCIFQVITVFVIKCRPISYHASAQEYSHESLLCAKKRPLCPLWYSSPPFLMFFLSVFINLFLHLHFHFSLPITFFPFPLSLPSSSLFPSSSFSPSLYLFLSFSRPLSLSLSLLLYPFVSAALPGSTRPR